MGGELVGTEWGGPPPERPGGWVRFGRWWGAATVLYLAGHVIAAHVR